MINTLDIDSFGNLLIAIAALAVVILVCYILNEEGNGNGPDKPAH